MRAQNCAKPSGALFKIKNLTYFEGQEEEKRQPTEGEKLFAKHISDKRLEPVI